MAIARGRRVEGAEIGEPTVRSIWLAQVEVLEWNPQFEIRFRRVVPALEAIKLVLPEYELFWKRAFHEAGIG